MNINALTLDEIIRTAEPETDLERRLLVFLTSARYVDLDKYECPDCEYKDDLEVELNGLEVELNDIQGAHEDLADNVSEAVDTLKKAIETLESSL